MDRYQRREFLADVGRGMLAASVGTGLAHGLGLAPAALAAGGADRLTFGAAGAAGRPDAGDDRLTGSCRQSSNESSSGTDLGQLVAAAALANARTFGGQDYEGYHALMALAPAFQMSQELSEAPPGAAGPEGSLPKHQSHPADGRRLARGAAPGRSDARCLPAGPAPRPCASLTRRRDVEGAERRLGRACERVARRGL